MQKYCRRKTTKALQEEKNGFSTMYSQNRETYAVSKVVHTQYFKSTVTQIACIFHNLNCKSKLLIYLMECRISRIQYIRKSETELNIRLSS